jgi:hypothetical protein
MAKDVDGVIKGLRQKLQKLGRLATNAPAIAFGAGQRGLLAKWLLDADVVDLCVFYVLNNLSKKTKSQFNLHKNSKNILEIIKHSFLYFYMCFLK